MTDSLARLDVIRREIDVLDTELLDTLSRRARLAVEVAAIKEHETEPRYYRPERETVLLRRLAAVNPGPLPDGEVMRLFREIVSTCRALEQRLTIGCATVEEACAATGHFGGAVDVCRLRDAGEALHAVATGRCDYAMLEFSRAHVASPAMEEIPKRRLSICGEWYAQGGDRFVAVGREPVPPTGIDWSSFILPTREVKGVKSWCRDSRLEMRAIPLSGAASFTIVDVAVHLSELRLGHLVARHGDGVLGAYPDSRVGGRGS